MASLGGGLGLIASYTYLDAEITESNEPGEVGESPTQVPEHDGSLWLEYDELPGILEDLNVAAGIRYLGSTWGNVPNTVEAPDTTLVDLAVHYDWNRYRFGVAVHNALDDEYVASCFVRGGTFCTFGATRTIRGTVGFRW